MPALLVLPWLFFFFWSCSFQLAVRTAPLITLCSRESSQECEWVWVGVWVCFLPVLNRPSFMMLLTHCCCSSSLPVGITMTKSQMVALSFFAFSPWRVEVLLPGCCSSSGPSFLPASPQPDCNRRFSLAEREREGQAGRQVDRAESKGSVSAVSFLLDLLTVYFSFEFKLATQCQKPGFGTWARLFGLFWFFH